MKRSTSWLLWPCLAGALLAGCSRPRVVQGSAVRLDDEAGILVVRDERPPHRELSFHIADAEIGGAPGPRDIVRIAYREEAGGALRATRVMNLSRRDTGRRH